LASTRKTAAIIDKKILGTCLAVILWAVLAANVWRFLPPDPDCVQAVSLYTEILRETIIIGLDYSSLTTTLGSLAIKKSSENPAAAALMVRLLKDAGVTPDSAVAINASGSFPGFILAALSACTALEVKTYVIASVGSSTYGANMPGNTIADILVKDDVRSLDYTLLAVTPGGSGDRGLELDAEELERVAQTLEDRGMSFIHPANLTDAVNLRESLLNNAGCTLLVNIGGSHASSGNDADLALMSGILKPDKNRIYPEDGLIQRFLAAGKPVIQILNVNRLYASYGLEFDQDGNLLGGYEELLRRRRSSPLVMFLPVLVVVVLLAVFRYSRNDQRQGQCFIG
jgi:poly-gamma-glutamate system protein